MTVGGECGCRSMVVGGPASAAVASRVAQGLSTLDAMDTARSVSAWASRRLPPAHGTFGDAHGAPGRPIGNVSEGGRYHPPGSSSSAWARSSARVGAGQGAGVAVAARAVAELPNVEQAREILRAWMRTSPSSTDRAVARTELRRLGHHELTPELSGRPAPAGERPPCADAPLTSRDDTTAPLGPRRWLSDGVMHCHNGPLSGPLYVSGDHGRTWTASAVISGTSSSAWARSRSASIGTGYGVAGLSGEAIARRVVAMLPDIERAGSNLCAWRKTSPDVQEIASARLELRALRAPLALVAVLDHWMCDNDPTTTDTSLEGALSRTESRGSGSAWARARSTSRTTSSRGARIGEIVFPSTTLWGRGDVANLYDMISQATASLRAALRPHLASWRNGTPEQRQFWEDWSRYHHEWSAAHVAYDRDPIVIPVATGSTVVEQARGFAQRYNALEARFTRMTGETPAPLTTGVDVELAPPSAPERVLGMVEGIAIALAVAAVGYAASKAL